MKDREKIERVAKAQWEKCEFHKMFTPVTVAVAERVFVFGFEAAIDHILSLPWPEGLEMIGYSGKKETDEPDYFKDFSPLEESTM